jgi:hypothetical protein
MKLKEYLSNCKLFPLMGVSQLNDIGSELDKELLVEYGEKSCGSLITSLVDETGSVSEDNQEFIAKVVYRTYKNKWDSLIKFAEEEINPLAEKQVTTTTEYGKVVSGEIGGQDGYSQTDKLSGFDSEDFVNKDSNEHTTTYGKTSETTNKGKDIKHVESRITQAEVLVDYTLQFWDEKGITRTVIHDTVQKICLPLYNLD